MMASTARQESSPLTFAGSIIGDHLAGGQDGTGCRASWVYGPVSQQNAATVMAYDASMKVVLLVHVVQCAGLFILGNGGSAWPVAREASCIVTERDTSVIISR